MPYELFIALRYLKARRKQTFVSVITGISMLGVIVGVTALVIALALAAGFRQDFRDKILGAEAHIYVYGSAAGGGLEDPAAVVASVEGEANVLAAAPMAWGVGLAASSLDNRFVRIKGVDPASSIRQVVSFDEYLVAGSLEGLVPPAGQRPGIVLGSGLARVLGVDTGDTIRVLTQAGSLSPLGLLPRPRSFRVAGVFTSGMSDYDDQWAFVSLGEARRLLGLAAGASVVLVRVADVGRLEQTRDDLDRRLGPGFAVRDILTENRPLFSALKVEKLMTFITIGLIVMVAALNIVSSLVMMVMEKTRDIAVLRSMGATRGAITRIFIFQGSIVGVAGTLVGCVAGLFIARALDHWQLIRLDPRVYYIDHVPFHVMPLDFTLVAGIAVLISFLATLYPAWQAARLEPAEALRYE